MVHGETFQAGRHIADNIYTAIRQSRKTLVLVTKHLLTSHWCTYELQMARMESISTGRNVLVFLFLEDIPANMVNIDVKSYIKTSTYIMYPKEITHREAFWNKLADDLRAP
uniref:TIR domain-containing protein n=1 Tax=Arion vulgaris TaxID=1028688 RepID=A0A0B6ZFE5_9EUPU